jgi:hypothetical protein
MIEVGALLQLVAGMEVRGYGGFRSIRWRRRCTVGREEKEVRRQRDVDIVGRSWLLVDGCCRDDG